MWCSFNLYAAIVAIVGIVVTIVSVLLVCKEFDPPYDVQSTKLLRTSLCLNIVTLIITLVSFSITVVKRPEFFTITVYTLAALP